jgi:hypothetical protein
MNVMTMHSFKEIRLRITHSLTRTYVTWIQGKTGLWDY